MAKRILIVFIALSVILLTVASFLLPEQQEVAGRIYVKFPSAPLERGFLSAEKWDDFFPGDTLENNSFKIKDEIYNIIGINVTSIDLETFDQDAPEQKWIANIAITSTSDSTFFVYQSKQARASNNPFTKISSWFKRSRQDEEIKDICNAAKYYLSSIEHVYDFKIIENNMPALTMVSTKMATSDTPDIKSIYDLIGTLRVAIKNSDATAIDSPMLNITRITEKEILTMVAIPVSKDIPGHGNILLKKMIPGNKLETTVKGGEKQLKAATIAMQHYMEDQRKTSPAIPYQSLITNRLVTPDSLWVTKINYPVF